MIISFYHPSDIVFCINKPAHLVPSRPVPRVASCSPRASLGCFISRKIHL